MSGKTARETPKALAAFHEYCLLGPTRSLRKLAEKQDKDGTKAGQIFKQLGEWSSTHHWQERVKEYDAARAEEKRIKQDAEIEAMNARHAQIGVTQQAKALKQIEALIEAKSFGSQAVVQLLKLATDLERIARGAPTKIEEVTGKDGGPIQVQRNTDLAALNDEELDTVETLLRQAQERAHGTS